MTPTQEFRFLILAAQRAGARIISGVLKPLGLTPAQAEVLQVLSEFGPISLASLGALLVCESGSPSRLVAGLVARDLVARTTSAEDGRAVELDLSPAGRALLVHTQALDEAIAAKISANLSADEIQAQIQGLRKLVQNTAPGQALARRRAARARRDSDAQG